MAFEGAGRSGAGGAIQSILRSYCTLTVCEVSFLFLLSSFEFSVFFFQGPQQAGDKGKSSSRIHVLCGIKLQSIRQFA